jgi:hypothetical protein
MSISPRVRFDKQGAVGRSQNPAVPESNDPPSNPPESDLEAFFRGEMVCELHPNQPFPHDECPGPGMPPPLERSSGLDH